MFHPGTSGGVVGIACAVAVALAAPSHAQADWVAPLEPATSRSPSGEYALSVVPSRSSGAGPGSYRFTRAGVELWSGERPWSLQSAALTDDGLVAGYAYGAGARGGKGDSLTVVLLDACGEVRLEERSERHGEFCCVGGPEPEVRGLYLDPANDRMVLRVAAPWYARETWWPYELSSGAALAHVSPAEGWSDAQHLDCIYDVRALPTTGLTLVHWSWTDWDRDQDGATFTLLDRDAKLVWRVDWPTDYTVRGDEEAEDALLYEMATQGAILAVADARFTLRHVQTNEALTFSVERAGERWRVNERARVRYEPPR